MPELIDKNAAYEALKHEADTHMLPEYKEAYERAARIIDQMQTIEAEPVRIIPKEVSATDLDKLTEMIKSSLLQAYPNEAMFTAVRHGQWRIIDNDWNCWRCTCCGDEWVLNDGNPSDNGMRFCPHCGAQMGGGAENG